jgi:hypothetical protein
MDRESSPAEGINNEIEFMLHLLRLPNMALPLPGQDDPDPYEQIRVALMMIRKKLVRIQQGEYGDG